jgi:hypothetical protein
MRPMRTLLVISLLGLVGAFFLAGCPPRPRPEPLPFPFPLDLSAYEPCPPTTLTPGPDAVCDGMFTPEGLACVNCSGGGGCRYVAFGVYCSNGPCMSDPKCNWHAGAKR